MMALEEEVNNKMVELLSWSIRKTHPDYVYAQRYRILEVHLKEDPYDKTLWKKALEIRGTKGLFVISRVYGNDAILKRFNFNDPDCIEKTVNWIVGTL